MIGSLDYEVSLTVYLMAVSAPPLGSRNPLCTVIRKAVQRGTRTDDGFVVAEGFHLLEEAQRSSCPIDTVIVTEAALPRLANSFANVRVFSVDAVTFASLSSMDTPQGVLGLVRVPDWSVEQVTTNPALVVVLDGLQDPGNAGAVVRAAEAFGASGVVFLKGSANPYHPKTLRAAAGSLFRVPFLSGLSDFNVDLPLFSMAADGPTPIDKVNWKQPCGVVIGNEGQGVRGEIRSRTQQVAIPTRGVESLNASVAAGIVLYEARRQRGPG